MKAAPLLPLLETLKKNKERVVLYAVIVLFCLLVVGGFLMQHERKQGVEREKKATPKSVQMQVQSKATGTEQGGELSESTPFFLEPSPQELLQQLTSWENLNEGAIEGKYVGLRVLWPAYFFALEGGEGGKGTLVLDVDENGFGVVIESEVDLLAQPRLKTLEVGEKLWIGGEIAMVDRSGTGTIVIKAENFHFDGDPIFSRAKAAK